MYYRKIKHSKIIDMTPENRLLLLEALKQAIRETNRGIVLNGLTQDYKHLKMQVYSLFKTWICREVRHKGLLDYCNTKQITDRDNLTIFTDAQHYQISGLKLECSAWYMRQEQIVECQDIFKELDYDDLLYTGVLYPQSYIHAYSKQKSLIDIVNDMNFNDLAFIQFK